MTQPVYSFPVTLCQGWSAAQCTIDVSMVSLGPHTYHAVYMQLGKTPCSDPSNTVRFADLSEPLWPRLSLSSDGSSVIVTWTTYANVQQPILGIRIMQPRGSSSVAVPLASDFLLLPASQTATYTVAELEGPFANASGWIDAGFHHSLTVNTSALFGDAAAGAVVEYRLGDKEGGLRPAVYMFRSSSSLSDKQVTMAVFGDLGVSNFNYFSNFPDASRTMAALSSFMQHKISVLDEPFMVFHNGDISYAMGQLPVWPIYMQSISPIASMVPWQTSIGNHEFTSCAGQWNCPGCDYTTWKDSGGECGIPYNTWQTMPRDRASGNDYAYSFRFGPVHFTVFSSEHDYTPGSPQHDWIQAELQRVDRSVTPWLIVASHRPAYTASENVSVQEGPAFKMIRRSIEPLLLQYKVDIYVGAHIHFYERTCPMASTYECGADGPIYSVVGQAGCDITPVPPPPRPAWSVANFAIPGFVVLQANATTLMWNFLSSELVSLDSFTLSR